MNQKENLFLLQQIDINLVEIINQINPVALLNKEVENGSRTGNKKRHKKD